MSARKVLITSQTQNPDGNDLIKVIGKRINFDSGKPASQPAAKRTNQTPATQATPKPSNVHCSGIMCSFCSAINRISKWPLGNGEKEEEEDTQNTWYVVNRGCLIPFTKEYQEKIEAAFVSNLPDVMMTIDLGESFVGLPVYINFASNTIKSAENNEAKRIVRTVDSGVFCSPHLTNNRFNTDTPVMIHYPAEWEPQERSCELKVLDYNNPERIRIVKKLREHGISCVSKIERIQNQHLWRRYFLEREFVKEKNGGIANEMELFHGTKSTPPVMIYNGEEGFDMRYANYGCWGKGIYFADSASYSHKYSYIDPANRQLQILMCRVAVGDEFHCPNGDAKLITPPPKCYPSQPSPSPSDNTSEEPRISFAVNFYDSVVGKQGTTTIRTVYSNSKAYPAYLITIQLL